MNLINRVETLFGFVIMSGLKRKLSKPQLKLGDEIIRRKKTLQAMSFRSKLILYQNGRSPRSTESLKLFWLLFYVNFDRNEVVSNELNDVRIRIDLGIQPGASCSHRSCAEIQQHRLILFFRF